MYNEKNYRWRFWSIIAILLLGFAALLWRLLDLSVFNRTFLLKQSNARAVRVISIPAYRGMIRDRFGTPLAISTPVDSLWVNPHMFQATPSQLKQLAQLTGMSVHDIKQHIHSDEKREFVYIQRGLPPDVAEQIKSLQIQGVFFLREYRRYYPDGDVNAQIIGRTNIDDAGQEGLELAYDKWLRGAPGKERVIKDRLGHIIAIMNILNQPVQGRDLILSLDDRIQFLAYRDLLDTVTKLHAASGSVVILNPKTGEILAMANVPSYNPNQRTNAPAQLHRNIAATDMFEPGSTMKSFSVANALASGKYTPDSEVDTNPGWFVIDGHTITDDVPNNGVLTVTQILQKSSNIGAAKLALSLPPQSLFNFYRKVGFGQLTGSGFPGEAIGSLQPRQRWSQISLATISFGYGVSVTALQLAHAYAILANNGVGMPVTFLKQTQTPVGQPIIPSKLAQQVLLMLETVVNKDATAAAIPGYRIAGKTGTAYIAGPHGYDKKHYTASFVGIAPVSNPQLVAVVVIHNVQGNIHFGAQVAAPIFANIMGTTLRILDIQPDGLKQNP